MRHNKTKTSNFGLKSGPKKALIRGLVLSLIERERIKTTLQRAKTIRPLVEKAITMGRKADLHSRRLLLSRYNNKEMISKIIKILSPRFKDRPGGYTRIIKLGTRLGDASPKALIEFVDYKFTPSLSKEEKDKQKVSKEHNQARKLAAKKKEKRKKSLRKMQAKSRKINRK